MRNLQISLPKVGTFSSRLLRQHRSQFASEYLISQPSNHPTTFPPAPCVDRLSTTRVVEAQNSQLGFVQGKSQHLSRGTKYLKVHHVDPSSISTKFNLPFFKLDIQMDVTIGYGDIPHLHLWVEPTKKKHPIAAHQTADVPAIGPCTSCSTAERPPFWPRAADFKHHWGKQAKMAVQKHHHPNQKIKTFHLLKPVWHQTNLLFQFQFTLLCPPIDLQQINSPAASIHSFVPSTLPVFTSHTSTQKIWSSPGNHCKAACKVFRCDFFNQTKTNNSFIQALPTPPKSQKERNSTW